MKTAIQYNRQLEANVIFVVIKKPLELGNNHELHHLADALPIEAVQYACDVDQAQEAEICLIYHVKHGWPNMTYRLHISLGTFCEYMRYRIEE